jgi:hypothetical protein
MRVLTHEIVRPRHLAGPLGCPLIIGWVFDHLRQGSLLDGASKRMENVKRQFETGKIDSLRSQP